MEAARLADLTERASLAVDEAAGIMWPFRRPLLRQAEEIQARARDIADFLARTRLRDGDAQRSSRVAVAFMYDVEDCLLEYRKIVGRGRRPFLLGLDAPFVTSSVLKQMHYVNEKLRILQDAARDLLPDLSAHDVGGVEEVSLPRRHLRVSDSIRRWDDRPGPAGGARLVEEYELLGMAAPKERLLQLLVEGGSELSVVAVVGLGGIGKTTLAQAVFNDRKVTERFDLRAWVCVSQEFSMSQLLRDVLLQLSSERVGDLVDADQTVTELSLLTAIARIRERLQNRRYAVVLDDVWAADAWEDMKSVFPDDKAGSRILVTSRSEEVAAAFAGKKGHLYRLGLLSVEDSWRLFRRFAFPSEASDDDISLPPDLDIVAREIVHRCRGLPLAVKAVGSLMANTPRSRWKELLPRVRDGLMDADMGEHAKIGRVLQLSYANLSHHLRVCLLYLSIYPADHKIRRGHLLRLWAAEGFVAAEQGGSTAEEVAETYLNELVNRSMVQVVDFDLAGKPRSLAIHDLIRDFIVFKSREENFVALSSERSTARHTHDTIRRLSIVDRGRCLLPRSSLSGVRTLITFDRQEPLHLLMPTSFGALRVLRVVDLEGANLWEFPADIVTLSLLRYLSLKDTHISSIPSSIEGLTILETLDLRGTQVRKLPAEIVVLTKLRYLLAAYCKSYTYEDFYQSPADVRVPTGIGQLAYLEKLSGINFTGVVDDLGELTRLRTLALTGLERENAMKLCLSMEKLRYLRSLKMHSASAREPLDLGYIDSPPILLEKLYLNGPIVEPPVWIASLGNLIKLVLQRSRMRKDPLKNLQDLANLQQLELWHDVYTGDHLCFGEEGTGGFPSLRILELRCMFGLEMVTIRSGTMTSLEKLVIERCRKLKHVPLGLENLTSLAELYVLDASKACTRRLQKGGGEDWCTIEHIPLIQIECGE